MKKLALTAVFASLLAGCQTSDIPADADIFEVKDNATVNRGSWEVDGINDVSEGYLYNIDAKVYEIVARRTANKLLNYTAPIADRAQRPTIYVSEAQVLDQDLPDGFSYSRKITKDLLENAQAFMIVNDPAAADYFLDTEVETVEVNNVETPVIIYRLILSDANEEVVKEWVETIRQVKNNDKSWW